MDDIFMEHHRQTTKSSMHEAFKDEVYASAITVFHGHNYHVSQYIANSLFPFCFGLLAGVIMAVLFITRG